MKEKGVKRGTANLMVLIGEEARLVQGYLRKTSVAFRYCFEGICFEGRMEQRKRCGWKSSRRKGKRGMKKKKKKNDNGVKRFEKGVIGRKWVFQ